PIKSWVWRHMTKDKIDKKIKCREWLKTSTTNLATHLHVEHRLDKNGPLLSLSGQ
ncbi:19089_t:CDS:2, partial [Gigaspora rosea]